MKTSVLMATLGNDGWDRYVPSLLEQTSPPDEVIVVFDNVLDEAKKERLQERWPSISFLFNDANIGQTRSLNRGLQMVRGDIVFRADDDDEYRHDRIELQLLCFENTGADLVTSWAEGIDEHSKKAYLIKSPTEDDNIKAQLLGRNLLVHSSLAFRRKRVIEMGGYDANFRYSQDYALYLAAIRSRYRFAAVAETLVRRHYSNHSITVSDRFHQIMFSCAARLLHQARSGDRKNFIMVMFRYGVLLLVPAWFRKFRRRMFSFIGRGS